MMHIKNVMKMKMMMKMDIYKINFNDILEKYVF